MHASTYSLKDGGREKGESGERNQKIWSRQPTSFLRSRPSSSDVTQSSGGSALADGERNGCSAYSTASSITFRVRGQRRRGQQKGQSVDGKSREMRMGAEMGDHASTVALSWASPGGQESKSQLHGRDHVTPLINKQPAVSSDEQTKRTHVDRTKSQSCKGENLCSWLYGTYLATGCWFVGRTGTAPIGQPDDGATTAGLIGFDARAGGSYKKRQSEPRTANREPQSVQVAKDNVNNAGLANKVDVRLGLALDTLRELEQEGWGVGTSNGPFDLVFIDADKPNNWEYVEYALKFARVGSVIVVDNIARRGKLADVNFAEGQISKDAAGTRKVLENLGKDKRVDVTALQTVGSKGWDGFALAVVVAL
ncbi:hypothetical protein O1611_g5863 [Lasiodiplodia mahajangana]|uniref:Uncharacterized protein n=1 Tax=Lasiodiplodia mahajangana TaxID=1108764 RepID=A0ACC2JJR3_9PEZI|nr:hypothetical protein O1611_g5863 [Lasiodiplodia mahajangana]